MHDLANTSPKNEQFSLKFMKKLNSPASHSFSALSPPPFSFCVPHYPSSVGLTIRARLRLCSGLMGRTPALSVPPSVSTSRPSLTKSIHSIYGIWGVQKQYDLIGETILNKLMVSYG